MKPAILLCLGACTIALSGCVTADTLDAAKARSHVEGKKVIVDEPARPGLYALLPLSIAADTELLPIYIPLVILVNTGALGAP